MMSAFRDNHRWYALAAVVGMALVMGFNLYIANHVSVVLPIVDGWAVWDRVLRFNSGAMGWPEYLFSPHGAHLHSIVYLISWFDYIYSDADQRLTRVLSLGAVGLFALAASWLLWKWGEINRSPLWARVFACVASAGLLTSVIDLETLVQPFQAVLSVSRLFYFGLLAAIIVGLVYRKTALYAVAITLSVVAVSFHGSGYLFAGLVILAHLLLARRAAALMAAIIPLAVVFTLQKNFADSGGELSHLDKTFTPGAFLSLVKGASAYFSMPLRSLIGLVGTRGLVVLGFVAMVLTAGLTLAALVQLLRNNSGLAMFRKPGAPVAPEDRRRTSILALVFLSGMFILLSAAAAAVFWIVRTSGPGQPAAHLQVLGSTRYTAYSTLAVVMILGFSLTYKRAFLAAGSTVASILLLIIAVWPAARIDRLYSADDQLNRAAAALSIGLSPLHPEAEVVWPQANTDWYWSSALPRTVAQLRLEHKSVWKHLPPLGAVVDGPLSALPVALTRTRTLAGSPGKCGIEGTLRLVHSQDSASTLVALVSDKRQVLGYAVRMRHEYTPEGRRIDGFFMCDPDNAAGQLRFMAELPSPWHTLPGKTELMDSAENLTDVTWVNGIARAWSGFFVKKSPKALQVYTPGTMLRMPDGQLKIVTKADASKEYLNVFLDGPPIDGNVNGYPHSMEIVR